MEQNIFPLEIKIKGLPKMTNTSRVHWRVIQGETKRWKLLVTMALGELGFFRLRPDPLKKAKITLIRHSAKRPDYDGLVSGFKRVLDSLTENGVIADDKWDVIGAPDYLWEKAKPSDGHVTIKVEEV